MIQPRHFINSRKKCVVRIPLTYIIKTLPKRTIFEMCISYARAKKRVPATTRPQPINWHNQYLEFADFINGKVTDDFFVSCTVNIPVEDKSYKWSQKIFKICLHAHHRPPIIY